MVGVPDMITPRPGFDPAKVAWEGPDEQPGDRCSYCGDTISEEAVPLILWNREGWCARFCDHCEAAQFGLQSFDDGLDDDDPELPDLGRCCMCDARPATTIAMLD